MTECQATHPKPKPVPWGKITQCNIMTRSSGVWPNFSFLFRGGIRSSRLQKPQRKNEHSGVTKILQNRRLEHRSLLLGWFRFKKRKRDKVKRQTANRYLEVAGRFCPMLCKEWDPGPHVPATHSSRPSSAQASVHLLEHLLADHTLHSHLLKQEQMLVIDQSRVTLGAQYI